MMPRKIFGVILLFLFFVQPAHARDCQDPNLKVEFFCEESWEVEAVDDAVLVVISSSPAVKLIVAKIDSPIKYLNEMTNDLLEQMRIYAPGFRTEPAQLGGLQAVKVKAFGLDSPGHRLLDYYVTRDGKLYGILFSVDPKDSWSEYQFIINRVVESFKFL